MLSSAWHEPLTVTNADGSSKELWVLDLTFDFELSMSYLAFERPMNDRIRDACRTESALKAETDNSGLGPGLLTTCAWSQIRAARPYLPRPSRYSLRHCERDESRHEGFYSAYRQILPEHERGLSSAPYWQNAYPVWQRASHRQVVEYGQKLHQALITLMYGKWFFLDGDADATGNVIFLANLVQLAHYYGCLALVAGEIETALFYINDIWEDVAHASTFHLVLTALIKSKIFFLDALKHHVNYYYHQQSYRELDEYQGLLPIDTWELLHLSRSQITSHILDSNQSVGDAF